MLRKLIIIVCLLSIVYVAFGQKKKRKQEKEHASTAAAPAADTTDYKAIGAPLPPIRLVLNDGTIITNRTLEHKGNLLIMTFNPLCGHCQDATKLITKNLPLFEKTRVMLFAAPEMKAHMSVFEVDTKISKYPKITIGIDSAKYIAKTFIYQPLPQINIYNKDNKLVKIFNGDISIDSLKPYIE